MYWVALKKQQSAHFFKIENLGWAAHVDIKSTVPMATSQFYWPNMRADIEAYVASCCDCRGNKADRRRRTPPLSPLVFHSSCWCTVGVDLILDLPRTHEGYNAMCFFFNVTCQRWYGLLQPPPSCRHQGLLSCICMKSFHITVPLTDRS
jgi:hypothetical protein